MLFSPQHHQVSQFIRAHFGQPASPSHNRLGDPLFPLDHLVDAFFQRARVRNLCTWTLRVWPMRKARSVAWSSTAGFHQRSKWKTWLARVRFSPVPPALMERMKIGGACSSSWKRLTIWSRNFTGVPPNRNCVAAPVDFGRKAANSAPISANWVKISARSPSASTSSRSSCRRSSLPLRPSAQTRWHPCRPGAGIAPDGCKSALIASTCSIPARAVQSFFLLDLFHHILDHRLIQCGLFFGQGAVDLRFHLGRQVRDHGWVGLTRRRMNGLTICFSCFNACSSW